LKAESRLQRRIRRGLKEAFGGHYYKIWGGPYQQAGIPDIIGCVEGRFVGLEVKQPGEEPSELQKIELENIRNAGGIAGVVTSVDEAIALVKNYVVRATTARTATRR